MAWMGREAFLVLSAMALALMLLAPPGFMVGGGGEGPARIVIRTGHGAVRHHADRGHAPADFLGWGRRPLRGV
jgi:hypothetical protein